MVAQSEQRGNPNTLFLSDRNQIRKRLTFSDRAVFFLYLVVYLFTGFQSAGRYSARAVEDISDGYVASRVADISRAAYSERMKPQDVQKDVQYGAFRTFDSVRRNRFAQFFRPG